MLHFSCDLCGKDLGDGNGSRYVVRIEVYPALAQAELTEDDLDSDPLDVMNEMLSELDDEDAAAPAPSPTQMRYDLCPSCHARFLRNPLNREALGKLNFSKN
ncbi:MAG TPA: hypothetical protein VIL46_02675 [Gemmataceae bacterium]